MPSERKRRAEVVRLIVTTRERFPHNPRLMSALRRMLWRYVQPAKKRPKHAKRQRRRDRDEG
jgi:hypothetical protein